MADDAKAPAARRILSLLPHRYPFLLVDRVIRLEPGRVVTLKNVSYGEPYFNGHFPDYPVMPGVLIVEAMAQSAAILALNESGEGPNLLFMLTGLDKVRFRRPVVPGDRLTMEVKLVRKHRPLWRMQATAKVEDELAAEAELSAMEAGERVR